MAHIINSKRISEILSSPEPSALTENYEIEDVLVKIEEIDRKVDFWNGLSKNRVQTIQNEIQEATRQKEFLRKVIQLTLESLNEDSLSFPGVGLVSKSKGKTTWIVTDKEKLIDVLKENLPEDRFNQIVSQKPSIDKRSLDDLLDKLDKAGEIPADCVKREEGESTIKLRFAKDLKVVAEETDHKEIKETIVDDLGDILI